MTREEELIKRYFDAFNQHDIEGVMACFHEHPVIVDPTGKRLEGRQCRQLLRGCRRRDLDRARQNIRSCNWAEPPFFGRSSSLPS
jgi:hypothetical protein